MTKVLLVAHTAAPSGAELATSRLAAALRASNARPSVDVAAVFTEDGPMVERMRARGIETAVVRGRFDSRTMTIESRSVRRLLVGFAGLIKLGWALGRHAREVGATVLLAESTKALVMGAVAARRARIPLCWQVHDRVSAEYFGSGLASFVRLLGWLVSDAYITNSRSTLESLHRWRRPTLVAYPGIEIGLPVEREAQRSADEVVVAIVGRLTRWKGQDVLLRALAEVTVRPQKIYVVGGTLFGEERYRAELTRLADELGLAVNFTGHVDDPREYMRQTDILVHCSVIAEPFGQVVVEGMHAGCAVIASRPGGPTEIIEPGVNGMLVDAADRHQLTDALDALIADRELRQRLADAARVRAARFDIDLTAQDVAAFLDTVVGRRRPERACDG